MLFIDNKDSVFCRNSKKRDQKQGELRELGSWLEWVFLLPWCLVCRLPVQCLFSTGLSGFLVR